MSDLQERLNTLAQRGTPRGFDAVFEAASQRASIGTVDDGTDVDDLAHDDDDENVIPFVSAEPVRRHRRPFGSMIAAAGVASLLLVGTLAVSAIVGSGGAGSPDGAVRDLANAVSHEDPLAAADVLAPSELKSLHGTLDEAAKKAQELKLVNAASAPLSGVNLNVDNLQLSTQQLADGYAKVTVDGGTLDASTEKAKFSALMQKALNDSEDNHAQVDLASLFQSQNLDAFVVTVRENGRWYVSAAYTVLEYIREYNKLPAAQYGAGVAAASTLGAESPDGAVQDAMRAFAASDWSRLITLMQPDQVPVYDYKDALLRFAANDGAKSDFTISSMSTDVTTDGETAKVVLHAKGENGGGPWAFDGGCFQQKTQYETIECSNSGPLVGSVLFSFFGGLDKNSTITVVQEHGRWFIAPATSVLNVVDNFVKQMNQKELYQLIGVPELLPAEGTITLGQPVSFSDFGTHVYTFEGHKGEQLLGLAKDPSDPKKPEYASIRFYGPDDKLVETGPATEGMPATLPADGTYKVLISAFNPKDQKGTAINVTLWDADKAPKEARQTQGTGGDSCRITSDGGEACFSSASGVLDGTHTSSASVGVSPPPGVSVPLETVPLQTVPPVTVGANG